MAGFDYKSLQADLGRYLSHLTPADGDMTFAILKAHLALEQVLQDYLDRRLPHPRELDGARLMFATSLALVRSVCPEPGHYVFAMAKALNGLRNQLAHRLEPADLAEKTRLFVRDCNNQFPTPMVLTDDIRADFERITLKVFGFLTSVLGLHIAFILKERQVTRLS
ncbi:hypothetical protein [Variovorax paradoxus]|uniref:hypothetical protein n=1 Tax=Variovorax paradoxus TaxID=34073 RepID=UPI00285C22E1|nr:hypothetical protein [Variovorax paradoxus]MDR6455484.1 hypothetical protein [Variovorax paradoxus]